MTATTSSKSPSFFGKRFKNNFKENKRSFIVHLIMSILGLPLLSVVLLITIYNETQYYDLKAISEEVYASISAGCGAFAVVGILCFMISLFLGITMALTNFKYLYKKSITDMNYALPLSGTQRFFADYLSGFTMYIAPIVGTILLSIAILAIGTPIVPEINELWKNFDVVIQIIFIVLIAIMQFYTLTVLAIVFCGNTFESIFSIFAFNVLIPAAIACVWVALCQSYAYGIDQNAIFYNNIFTSTSPIGSISFFAIFAESSYYPDSFSTFLYTKWTIITLAVTAVYLIAAYLLYRYRKAEDVSKPYVYKSAFYAIMTMGTFCVLSLFINFGGFLAAGIVLCGIIWFIMEVITRRGFKKFWQAGLGFGAAVISVIVLCNLFSSTKGFGMAKKVPSAAAVESITIREDITDYGKMIFRDKKVIEEAVKLHEELVDRHFNQEEYTYNTTTKVDYSRTLDDSIYLQYSTYTGSTISREYTVPSNMSAELKKAILLSDDYAEQICKEMFQYEIEYYDEYGNITIDFANKAGDYLSKKTDRFTLISIRDAYKKDLMNMTEDDLLNAKYCGKIDNQYFVLETFDNTLSILEDLEIDYGDLTRADLLNSVDITRSPVFYSAANLIFTNDYTKNEYYYYYGASDNYAILDSISGMDIYYNEMTEFVSVSDTVVELINRSTPMVWGEMPIAVFDIQGQNLYLLDRGDNKELLDSLEVFKWQITDDYNDYDDYYNYGWD